MKILFVFSHPDDEAFACAGTIKNLTKSGHHVVFVETTDGNAGQVHINARKKLDLLKSVENLRQQELKKSAKILGVKKIYYLGYPDGSLNNKLLLSGTLVNKIKSIIIKETPQVVVAYDHTGISWHLDHIATSIAASKAAHECQDIVDKMFLFVSPNDLKLPLPYLIPNFLKPTHRVNITKVVLDKINALKAHLSQQADWERFLARENNQSLKYENYYLSQDRHRNSKILSIFKKIKPV